MLSPRINGIVTVEAHAKYKTTADIHIDAGRDVRIDLGGGQMRATALTSAEGSSNASVLIHAGRESAEKGNITITNPKSADKAIYLHAQTQGSKTEIYSDGKAPANTDITDGKAHAKLELDEEHTGDCPDCPTPPGLDPPLSPPPTVVMPFISAVPGLERVEFDISGCPALVKWVASELGIDERMMQIWTVNALASSRDIQPCDACERLKGVAAILRDDEGTRIAALAQVIGEFAPSTAPPTDEQMAFVADAIQRNSQAYNNYATAGEYLDALVVYVGILSNDLNFSAEESVMFAVDNYVAPLAENQSVGLAAYVAARLAALGGS